MSRGRTLLRWLIGLLLAAWSLLLVGWLTLHWGILPQLDRWKPEIERQAARALGAPVLIGNIAVQSQGWVPTFELRDVRVLDPAGRPAMALPRVLAVFSPRSVLALELRFQQLLIEGAQLDVRRDAQGRIVVGGLLLGDGKREPGDTGAAADWFFRQQEFAIRGGTVRWTDERRGAGTLALTDVQLVVRNGLRRHDLRLDATPPPGWGERFTLSGRFTAPLLARAGDWQRWSGSGYASLPRADVGELRRHVDLPFQLDEGNGALRVWAEVREGELRTVTADVALRAVRMKLGRELEPLTLQQVQGRFEGTHDDKGYTLLARQFGFVTDDDLRWPATDMNFAWRQRDGQPSSGGEFGAQRIDLELVAKIASRVPLALPLRRWLDEAQPQGLATELLAQWEGPLDHPAQYRVRGHVGGLSWRAGEPEAEGHAGRPGVGNLDLAFDASERGGNATVLMDGGMVELPGRFVEPQIPIDRAEAQLIWRLDPPTAAARPVAVSASAASPQPRLTVQVKDARIANADLQAELNANWVSGDGAARFPGRLELTGKLGPASVDRIVRYVPLGAGVGARDYLTHALRAGRMSGATVRVRGDLRDFPFDRLRNPKDGEFRVATQVENVDFVYVPGRHDPGGPLLAESLWPAFRQLRGEVIFERAGMEIRNAQAQVYGLAVNGVRGRIAHWGPEAALAIDGTVSGPMTDLLRYTNSSPVGGWLGQSLATTTSTGPGELKLALNIPLNHGNQTTVKGSLTLPGNDLRLRPDLPLLANARGRFEFTERGFSVAGASARAFGGDLTLDGGTAADGAVRFVVQGSASAEGLRRSPEAGALSRLAASLSGQTAYRATLGFARGRTEATLTSHLVGLGSTLPAPLGKAAEVTLPLQLQVTPVAGDVPRDQVRLELGGSLLQLQAQRDLSGSEPRVLSGGIGVNESAPQPAAGVAANINVASLNADAWQQVMNTVFPARDGGEAGETGGLSPTRIGLRAGEFTTGGRRLNRLVAGATLDDGSWRINLDAEQLNGYVEYRLPQRGAGRVHARLARLSLPKSDAEQVDSLLDAQTTTVPALDIVIDDFDLRGKKLGKVEVEAVNRAGAEGREWRLSKLSVTTPEAHLAATGVWARRRATMDFTLDLSDSGALLERLAIGRTIRHGKGKLEGQISWLGSPLALDYPSLAGKFNVAIESGQFLKVEAGATRLLSVLSLQSLPRRLLLDFRDVFQEGFAFDSIGGDVTIAQGIARTNNLRMRGVQAAVLMEGSADLIRETQDLRVVVVPEINAGTASLAYAVINPAIGLGTFLAQALMRKPLMQAGTREFRVTGPWADPKIDRVERGLADPVPDLNEPLPASAPAAAASEPARR